MTTSDPMTKRVEEVVEEFDKLPCWTPSSYLAKNWIKKEWLRTTLEEFVLRANTRNTIVTLDDDTVTLLLTRDQVTVIDRDDLERVADYQWSAVWDDATQSFYAKTNVASGVYKQTTLLLHRFITGAEKGTLVDHKNHDTLDNRKQNLRLVTGSQNQMNRGIPKNNTSGYKGVCWHRKNKRWRAQIKLNGKKKFLGEFHTPEEASEAYEKAAQLAFQGYYYTPTDLADKNDV